MQAPQLPATEWASDNKVAQQFDLTVDQLRAASRRGEFPAPVKFGRQFRYRLSDIQAWVAAQAGAAVQVEAV